MTTSEKSYPEMIEKGGRVAVFVDVEVSKYEAPFFFCLIFLALFRLREQSVIV